MGSKYLDEIYDLISNDIEVKNDTLKRSKEIANILLKTNESLNSFPLFKEEVKKLLIILIDQMHGGISPHLYHDLGSMELIINRIKEYNNPNFISKDELKDLINKTTLAHIVTMHCMVLCVYNMTTSIDIDNYTKER
jgi:hypothetical protein